jgi:hypothetical protein
MWHLLHLVKYAGLLAVIGIAAGFATGATTHCESSGSNGLLPVYTCHNWTGDHTVGGLAAFGPDKHGQEEEYSLLGGLIGVGVGLLFPGLRRVMGGEQREQKKEEETAVPPAGTPPS